MISKHFLYHLKCYNDVTKHPSNWLALLLRFVWCKHDKNMFLLHLKCYMNDVPKDPSGWLVLLSRFVELDVHGAWQTLMRSISFFPTQKLHTWRPFVLESNVNVICGFDRHLCETNWMCLQVWENCMEGLWRNISQWPSFSYLET